MALRVLRTAALPVAVFVAVVLGLSAAGAAPTDPFVGAWKSVDTRDSSNQRLTIARQRSGSYVVDLSDDLASGCGGGAATGKGTATRSGSVVSGLITITCANGQTFADVSFKFTHRKASDTLIDGQGVVWSRVKAPAPEPKPKPGASSLPLGRLVLAASEAPGLKPRPLKPSAAKKALADSLRPAKLPGFSPSQTQVARYGKGSTEVMSLAFAMKSTAVARAAAKAIAKAGRGSRISLGDNGYALRRKQAAVAWHRGRVVSAIVFQMRGQTAPVRTRIALGYGRTADARVEHALTQTALDRVAATVGSKGVLSRNATLDLFALAFEPLPGTKRPPGPTGKPSSGTEAILGILRIWKTLTAAQRDAAAKLIGVTGVSLPGARSSAGAERRADFGDPNFTPDVAMTSAVEQFMAYYQQKLKVPVQLKLVAGPGSDDGKSYANAAPIDAQGNLTPKPSICRVVMTPAGMALDPTGQLRALAHETFHCMQYEILGPLGLIGKLPAWISQGTAEWAAFRATGAPWKYAYTFEAYLNTCATTSLYQRVDGDAIGFFGHTDDFAEDFWKRAEAVVTLGAKYGSGAAYDAARGGQKIFLDTWASSALISPPYGLAWTSTSPTKPPFGSGCAPIDLPGDAPVKSDPLTTWLYYIENVAQPNRPLLHITIDDGNGRIGDTQFVDETVVDSWYCIEGECKCPEGTEGSPPAAPTLRRPAVLGLTGGKGAGKGSVAYVALDEFCKQRQPPPPIQCQKDSHGGATGSGPCPPGQEPVPTTPPGQPGHDKKKDEPPDPVGCTGHGCAQSAADPHLLPFGGSWYDFQGVGEFTLVRSTNSELEVQVRQEPWPGSKVVSMNTAAAMRVAGDRVTVYKGQPLSVRVNGRPVLLTTKDVRLPKGGVIRPLSQGQLDVIWPDGTVVRVTPPTNMAIDLTVSLAPKWLGKVTGLLGDNDGNTADDFKTRGGRALDAKVIQGTDKRAYNLLYRVFGGSWRVSSKTSLFDYASGQSTRTFTDARFPARIVTVENVSPAARRKAEKICRRMGLVQKDVLDACILDVAQTGSYGFSTALALAQLGTKKAKKPAPPPPPPPAGKPPGATLMFAGKTYSYKRAGAGDGCSTSSSVPRFSVTFRGYGGKTLSYGFKLAVNAGTKDGTYTAGVGLVFEGQFGGKLIPILVENLKVTLTGKRTRGTFAGTASTPGGDPVSGSFSCG